MPHDCQSVFELIQMQIEQIHLGDFGDPIHLIWIFEKLDLPIYLFILERWGGKFMSGFSPQINFVGCPCLFFVGAALWYAKDV